MRTTLVLAGMLLAASLVLVPGASADHYGCDLPRPSATCEAVVDELDPFLHRAMCFYETAPQDWVATCA